MWYRLNKKQLNFTETQNSMHDIARGKASGIIKGLIIMNREWNLS